MDVYPTKRRIYNYDNDNDNIGEAAAQAQQQQQQQHDDGKRRRYKNNAMTTDEVDVSREYDKHRAEPLETNDCKVQYEWQRIQGSTSSGSGSSSNHHPTCNTLHETNMVPIGRIRNDNNNDDDDPRHVLRLIGNGYYRDVWTIREWNYTSTSTTNVVVLKTLRWSSQDFTERNYVRHYRDATIMEHLTTSPSVLDIYAHCGNSGLFEYANGGDVLHLIWGSNNNNNNSISSESKLTVATQCATAVADLHNVDGEGRASIAHTDISPGQFVRVATTATATGDDGNGMGVYKLNDFNRARFLTVSTRDDSDEAEPCGYYVGNNPGTNRSPEEYMYAKQSEKVDIYSLGNIFYMLLTKQWPWQEMDDKEAKQRVKNGERPPIPKEIQKSSNPVDQTLMEAMIMSQRQDPNERATARQVETYLKAKLHELYPNSIASTV